MILKRDAIDTLGCIGISAGTVGDALASSMKSEKDPFAAVSNYRQSVEQTLESLDERMCAIMTDKGDRVNWASRMGSCQRMMRTITVNLAVWGKPEYDWNEVGQAMGFLRAMIQGAEMTLGLNEPKKSETETVL